MEVKPYAQQDWREEEKAKPLLLVRVKDDHLGSGNKIWRSVNAEYNSVLHVVQGNGHLPHVAGTDFARVNPDNVIMVEIVI